MGAMNVYLLLCREIQSETGVLHTGATGLFKGNFNLVFAFGK